MESREIFVETNGAAAMLFSIPFMLIGVGTMAVGVWAVVARGVSPLLLAFLVPFGLVFPCFGAAVGFSRRTLILDADARTTTRSFSIFVTFKRTAAPLGEWEHVGLARERRRTRKSSYIAYPVFLARQGESFFIQTTRDYASARAIAERAAKVCRLGVRDAAGEDVVMRQAGKLDESLRDRLRRTGEKVRVPRRPEDARATTANELGTLVVSIPARGLRSFGGIVAALMLCGLVVQTVIVTVTSGEVPFVFLPVDAAIVVFFIAPILMRSFTAERLTVSASNIGIVRRSVIGERETTVPTAKVEEVRLGDLDQSMLGGGLVIVTDERIHTVAAGTSVDERRWLAGEIQRALAEADPFH